MYVNIRNNNVDILTGLIYVDMRNKIIGHIITIDRNNSHICINISHVDIDKFHVNINFSYTDIHVNTIILHLIQTFLKKLSYVKDKSPKLFTLWASISSFSHRIYRFFWRGGGYHLHRTISKQFLILCQNNHFFHYIVVNYFEYLWWNITAPTCN